MPFVAIRRLGPSPLGPRVSPPCSRAQGIAGSIAPLAGGAPVPPRLDDRRLRKYVLAHPAQKVVLTEGARLRAVLRWLPGTCAFAQEPFRARSEPARSSVPSRAPSGFVRSPGHIHVP